jgi:hypothetical protein
MATGWLAWTCLLLAGGAPGSDEVVYMNQRAFQFPIKILPERQADVREVILYMSRNQGKNWEIYGRARPDSKAFDFFAAGDGLFYFSVAVTDRRGLQDPPDIYKAPVGQKIYIDTAKPAVHVQAERFADEVQVGWEARDEFPDWASLKLEYRLGDAPNAQWTPLPLPPGERGNLKFKPGAPGDVTLRLALRDLAGNEGVEEKVVPGTPTHHDRAVVRGSATVPPPPDAPPPSPIGTSAGPPAATAMASAAPRPAAEPPPPGSDPASRGSPLAPSRGSLPPLQIVNKRQVQLGFDVTRFGPSGLGSVDVYVTADEGTTWQKSTGDPAVSLPVSPEVQSQGPVKGTVTVQLPEDGKTYGFYLVVKSRAGLGKPPPHSGDLPQVRLECDTTQPSAELYAPQPDSERPGSLSLSWKAEDRNLAANPVTLEWSANGTAWEFIGDAQLPNTGRYIWQVPTGTRIPPKVYLKLTVRDTAGNVAVAQTKEAVLIDLTVPEIAADRVQVIMGR